MDLPSMQRQSAPWSTREDAETDWEYGQRPEQRSIKDLLDNGILLIDKPNGPTSNQVSGWVKDVLNRDRTGHAGTLDPHVTGVLPIGLNRATKVLGYMSNADKRYTCVLKVQDRIDYTAVREAAEGFVGTIEQVPPEHSAVKREARDREIYGIDVLEVDGKNILFEIACEKGFYVRNFCETLAEALDTDGEMAELRRTHSGAFTEDDTHILQDVTDAYAFWRDGEDHDLRDIVLPVEAGVRHIRKIIMKDSAVAAVAHGANLGVAGVSKLQDGITEGEPVALLTLKGELVAIGNAAMDTETILEADDGDAATLERVFIGKDVYPKHW